MKNKLLMIFLFICLFNASLLAKYEYKEDLRIIDVIYIQNLTEYSEKGSIFNYAWTPGGFDVNTLSSDHKKLLLSLFRKLGISVNRKSFSKDGENLKKLNLTEYNKKLKSYLDIATKESETIFNLSILDVVELTWHAGVNGLTLFSDLYGISFFVKAKKIASTLNKSKSLLSSYNSSLNEYLKVKEALKFFDSDWFIVMSTLINNGFTYTNDIKNKVDNNEALKESLYKTGMSLTGKIAGAKYSFRSGSVIKIAFIAKTIEMAMQITSNSVILMSKDKKFKKIAIELLNILSDFIPIYGPLHQNYKDTQAIFSRSTSSPKAIKAWADYLVQSKIVKDKINSLLEKDFNNRLKAIVDYANNISLDSFPDINRKADYFVAALIMKKLNIVRGKEITYSTGITQLEFRGQEFISIGEVLKMLVLIEFPTTERYDTLDKYKDFLVKKEININNGQKKLNLSELATRGYIAKVIMNIENHKDKIAYGSNRKIVSYTTVDNDFIVDTSLLDVCSSDFRCKQIETCDTEGLDSDWDQCSVFLRYKKITLREDKFEPNQNITRREMVLMLYRLYKYKNGTKEPTIRKIRSQQ